MEQRQGKTVRKTGKQPGWPLLAGALLLAGLAPARANEDWTGATTGGDWLTNTNWSGNAVPNATDDVTIVGTANGVVFTNGGGVGVTVRAKSILVDGYELNPTSFSHFIVTNGVQIGRTTEAEFTLDNGSSLVAASLTINGAAGTSNVATVGGTLDIEGGIITVGNATDTSDLLTLTDGAQVTAASIRLDATGTLSFQNANTPMTFSTAVASVGTGTGTIDSAGNSTTTLTGDGSGFSGGFTLHRGTLAFVNASYWAHSTGVTFSGGALEIGATASTQASSTFAVNSTFGGIDVDGGAVFTHAGTITGAAGNSLNVVGSGLLVLSGDGSAFAGGLLTNGGGHVEFASGAVFGNGTDTQVDAGTGSIRIDAGAQVSAISFTSLGGLLQVDGTATTTGSLVTITGGGTLAGRGTINGAAGTVVDIGGGSQGATLAVGNVVPLSAASVAAADVGTLTINGGLTLESDATTILKVAGTSHTANRVAGTDYDHLAVSGATQLGGTLVIQAGAGVFAAGDTFDFITSTGGITGTFNAVNILHNALLFTTSIQNAGADFVLAVTAVQGSFTSFALDGNQLQVAHALDSAANDPRAADLIAALNGLPGTSLPSAFTLISPVQETTVSQTSLSVSRAAFGTLQQRLGDIRAGSTGLSLSQFNLLDQNLPAASLIAGTELPTGVKAFQPAPDNRWGFFAAANGDFGDIDGELTQSNYHGAGFTAGSDYRIDNAFAVGFALGYDYSKTDFDHSGSNSTANSIRFGPYATWRDKTGDWVDGTLGGAYHFYDSNRQGFGGTASSSTGGTELDASLKYGHDFKVGQWTLTPTAGLDFLHLDIDKYAETGSLAPLAVRDQTADSFRGNLGGIAAYGFQWKGIGWNPYVQAGWAHEFLDASQSVSARFASGAGDVFSATGDNLGHDSATFGAGLEARLTETLAATLSYAGEANDRYQNHSLNAAVRVQF